ncbi:Protein unc-80 [Armadillidium vulgare]|nr:Protein unc-80 [Armadillidium vulgare]
MCGRRRGEDREQKVSVLLSVLSHFRTGVIYLFAPLLHTLKESDFQNFRLENGLKIWNALWEFRHPDVPVLTTPGKA